MQHFNQILNEVSADYFMLFHDDDVMLPGCLNSLMHGYFRQKNIAAVGGNSAIIIKNFVCHGKLFIGSGKNVLVRNPRELLMRYFLTLYNSPFPSYLYYRPAVGDLRLPTDLGKHADVIFLAEVARRGNILMLPEVVMHYRLHESQDSAAYSFKDRRIFVNWVVGKRYFKICSPEIRFYRLIGLMQKLRKRSCNKPRLTIRLLTALAVQYVKHFRLQFFFLFIRLAQRILQNWYLQRKIANANHERGL